MADKPLSAAEYGGWLTPDEALKRFRPSADPDARKQAIIRRLADSEMRAAGRLGGSLSIIDAALWREARGSHDALWAIGDAVFLTGGGFNQLMGSDSPIKTTAYLEVRFDPLAFGEEVMEASETPQTGRFDGPVLRPGRKQDLPMLPEPIAEAWAKWFLSQPTPTKERAEASALQMFPNHNLSRDRVRELMARSRDEKRQKP